MPYSKSDIRKVVNQISDQYKERPIQLVQVAISNDLAIYESEDFGDDEAGTIHLDSDRNEIFLNNKLAGYSKRFALAHELGHFFLHRELYLEDKSLEHVDLINQYITDEPEFAKGRAIDIEANSFAMQLLLPELEFIEAFKENADLTEISDYFGVPHDIIVARTRELMGIIFV